ncbi:EF-hand domain-containing protein [Rhodanobacter sp. L36]|uniref:EF-hand domain-containing protein n=1 Tax=Rhodanobacter sp. L36 TaxID=1747221 RepID=UPI00131AB590|nr:EF-hand domain-containing protein [Rhodanobacter sp. L36]
MRLACVLVAMALASPLAARAQDSRTEYLRLFDSNGDGRVSEAEYLAYMSHSFQAMDSNGDGILETDELPGGRGRPITLQAYQDNLRAQFHKLDRNRDGYLSARELTAPPR